MPVYLILRPYLRTHFQYRLLLASLSEKISDPRTNSIATNSIQSVAIQSELIAASNLSQSQVVGSVPHEIRNVPGVIPSDN